VAVTSDTVGTTAKSATPMAEPVRELEPKPAPTPKPAPVPDRKAPAPATAGAYALQLGSYRSTRNADAQVQRLEDLGHAAVIETAVVDGLTWHRVMLHGMPDRAEAERVGESIRVRLGSDYLIRRSR
jgi:cell division septation protein DedD